MRIVVIDSGYNCGPKNGFDGVSIEKHGDNYCVTKDISDAEGHGTKVVDILLRYGRNIQLFIVKIATDNLDDDEHTEILMYALEYAATKINPDIINISMGLEHCYRYLEFSKLCDKIRDGGIYIVAAYSNTGSNSYPAVFNSVIGVDWCIDCDKISQYILVERLDKVDIRCSISININRFDYRGNSFLAPYISALINNILEKSSDKSYESLKAELIKGAYKVVKQVPNEFKYTNTRIRKAILFPYNKEIKSLVINRKMIDFKIEGIYDIKYSPNFHEHIQIGSSYYYIENYKNIQWENDFDTVVLGHVQQLSKIIKKDLTGYFIQKSKEYGKFLYSFDDMSSYVDVSNMIYYPRIDHHSFQDLHFGKLFHIPIPVLVVLGTRSRQGKFFVQQKIREYFDQKGASVGYLSTEPSGFLIGADAVYPIGYGANVHLSTSEQISCANYLLNDIAQKGKDIIITGGQSQIINNAFGNVHGYPIEQYAFLLACEPDEVVLCVSYDDDIEYITKSIQFIESVAEISIIAIVLSHIVLDNNKEKLIIEDNLLDNRKEILKEKLSKPVFRCDQEQELFFMCDLILSDLQ